MKTSVEWLVEELRGYDDKGDFIFNGVITSELIEQAKEMHNKEIIEAYRFGLSDEYVIGSQKYYNQTFGGKDE